MMLRRGKHSGGGPQPNPFLNLVPTEWNPIFAIRREDIKYAEENVPLFSGLDLDDGVVRSFMKSYDESDACLPRADKVEEYCFGATLERLQEEERGEEPTVAWLDERSSGGGEEKARTYRGPLSARGLYKELRKPRYHVGVRNIQNGSAGAPDTGSRSGSYSDSDSGFSEYSEIDLGDQKLKPELTTETKTALDTQIGTEKHTEPDAERTKIFVTDLDRWSIYALITTASASQASGLRDAIYKHLKFENFIGVTFPSAGLAMFQLAFHIPFYAWRVSNKAQEDDRLNDSAVRLRKSRDVSFLNWKSSGPSDFLYEAQYSCLVAGSDEWHWVAYGFFDTYFDAAETRETVQDYHNESVMEEGLHVDPLTFGVVDANKTPPTAREYWLRVFRIRITHVMREWEQVVSKVEESIREYRQTHIDSSRLSIERSSPAACKEYDEKVRKARDWVVYVKRLTIELLQHLSKTVDACKKFCVNYFVYFQNLSEPVDGDRMFPAIQLAFDRLESLNKDLNYAVESCTDFVQDLELQVVLESNQMFTLQQKLAEENKSLTWIMMVVISPIALSAGIFSMQADVLHPIPANFGWFVGSVFVFAILGVIILVILQYQNWCLQVLRALAGHQPWQAMMLRRKAPEDSEQLSI